jgi:hypothetical protein
MHITNNSYTSHFPNGFLNYPEVEAFLNRTENPFISMSKRKGDSDSRLDMVMFYSKLRAW